jgi:hypothetical protein
LFSDGGQNGNRRLPELRIEDVSGFRNFLMMAKRKLAELRAAIPPSIRLTITLRYLASGDILST